MQRDLAWELQLDKGYVVGLTGAKRVEGAAGETCENVSPAEKSHSEGLAGHFEEMRYGMRWVE